jgi:hypothetical protein
MNEQFVQAINYTFLWHKETAFVLQRQVTPIGQVTSHLAIMRLPADSNELTLFSSAATSEQQQQPAAVNGSGQTNR